MARSHSEHTASRLLSIIFLSFLIALPLSIYPLSPSVATLRPMILIMVLIFWLLFQPRHIGILSAFILGLIIDLLMDTRLGQHAFAAVLMVLVIKISASYIKSLSTTAAWFLATIGLIVFQLTLWLLQLMAQDITAIQSSLPLLVSIISWPLVLLTLRRFD